VSIIVIHEQHDLSIHIHTYADWSFLWHLITCFPFITYAICFIFYTHVHTHTHTNTHTHTRTHTHTHKHTHTHTYTHTHIHTHTHTHSQEDLPAALGGGLQTRQCHTVTDILLMSCHIWSCHVIMSSCHHVIAFRGLTPHTSHLLPPASCLLPPVQLSP
jgi:hypothetical protein